MSLFRYRDQEAKNIAKATADARRHSRIEASLAKRKADKAYAAEIDALKERVSALEALVASIIEASPAGS